MILELHNHAIKIVLTTHSSE